MLKKIKQHKIFIFIITLIVLVIISGQYLLNKGENISTQNTQATSAKARKGNITNTVSASGQIQTSNYLAITTSVNGIVKKVFVKEGDTVKDGQKIMEVTLDSEGQISQQNAYAAYLRAKNSLENARTSLYSLESAKIQKEEAFDKVKEESSYQTHDERLQYKLAENEYLKAKSDLEQQQAVIQQSTIALNSAWDEFQAQSPIITATANGTIANIVAVEGTRIENTVSERSVKTVASIKQEGTPIASVNISELDINSIKVGQEVELVLNSISDKTFIGTVAGIDKIGSVSSGVSNYPVIIKFNETNDQVLPNMGVDASIIIAKKESVLYVPTAAIRSMGNDKIVTVVNKDQKVTRKVTVGISDTSNTEIVEGLSEGEEVMINSLPTTGFESGTNQFRPGAGFGIIR